MPNAKSTTANDALKPLIFSVRGMRVMLDADLARLYGVGTKVLNQAVKRNPDRFPEDFGFQMTMRESESLRSQFVTSNAQFADSARENGSGSSLANRSRGGRRHLPWAFTEHGALMAANILRSAHAVQMSVYVVRAFVRIRQQVAANTTILKRLAEIDRTLLAHDSALRDVYNKLLPLLQPPPSPPKRRIGFIVDDA